MRRSAESVHEELCRSGLLDRVQNLHEVVQEVARLKCAVCSQPPLMVSILSMPGAANYAEGREAVEIEHHKFVRIGLGTMHRGVKSAAGRGRVIPRGIPRQYPAWLAFSAFDRQAAFYET
jgi:hypothetical protein